MGINWQLGAWRPLGAPDRTFVLMAVILAGLGLLMVASSSIEVSSDRFGNPLHIASRQALFLLIAAIAGVVAFCIPTRAWYDWSTPLLVFSILLLGLVLVPGVGLEVKGARRWLNLGVFNLQPSEVAKFTMMLFLASYLFRRLEEVRLHFSGFVKPLAVVAVVSALLLLEPDFGTLLILSAAVFGVLLLAGARLHQYLSIIAVMIAVFLILAFSADYRVDRILMLSDPWADRTGAGYQLTQALLAFGRGGITGLGLGNSVQKLFYLPEAHTDFVFAILGEELGLIGTLGTLLIFGILIWRGLGIARTAELSGRPFAAFFAYGIVLLFALQTLVNLLVNIGFAPTTGLTLPFLSYGGSSLVTTAVGLGVVARVSADSSAGGGA